MNDYWKDRALQRELESQLIADKHIARMDGRLREAQQNINREIESFYARYSVENKVTMTEARKYLNAKEMKDFKDMDLKKFRTLALANNPAYEQLLNSISSRVRISRLEILHAQIQVQLLDMYGGSRGFQGAVYSGLSEVYESSYYQMMFDMAKVGVAAGTIVTAISGDVMKEVLSYNWSGKEFSKRIWDHQAGAIDSVRKELERSFAGGRSLRDTTKAIMEKTNVSRSKVENLVRTESNFFHGLAAQNSYRDAELEKYEILSTLDGRTSDTCRYQDGKIYNVKDYNPGVNANPFHARCRTTTIPWFDESEYLDGEKRQSADGLIDSMTYEQWFSKYVI